MINKINESIVYYYLKNLVDYGTRYTGTLNCYLAGEYIFEEFKKMGLEVKFENWYIIVINVEILLQLYLGWTQQVMLNLFFVLIMIQ